MGADNSSPGQDEAYTFYGGIAQQLGQYFGAPTSSQYQGARPGDFSSPAARDQGSRVFSSTVGLQTPNQTFNILGGMVLQGALGNDLQNVRPFGSNSSTRDFIEGRQRSMQSQAMAKDILQLNAPYYSSRIGNAGNNMGAQMMLDALNPAGSQVQAFNQIYANQGRAFGSTEQQRSEGAFNTVLQMKEEFAQESGPNVGGWDFRKSYGFDYNESAEGADVAIRRGIGGMSADKLASAVGRGEGGAMIRDNNRVFAAARELFGRDKTMEQLGELITTVSDSTSGLDASQTETVLQKIDAARRTVDMSTEAFTEYSKLLTDMYRSMGMTGSSVTNSVLSSMRSANIATETGARTGDPTIGDRTKNLEAVGINMARTESSSGRKMIKAVAALANGLTNEQKSAIHIEGMGTMAEVMEVYKKAVDEGDFDTLKSIATAVNKSGNAFFDLGDVSRRANNWTEYNERAANNEVEGLSKLESGLSLDFRKFVDKGIAGKINKGIMGKIGEEGFKKLTGRMDSPIEAMDRNKVAAIIKDEFGGMGLSQQEQDMLASQFAMGAQDRFAQAKDFGYQNETQAGSAYAETSDSNRAARRRENKKEEALVKSSKYLAEISGDVMRPFGAKEGWKEALNLVMELQNGTIDGKSVIGKDGKWDMDKVFELLKTRTKGVLKISETKDMMQAAKALSSPEAISEVKKAGEDAASQAKNNGASPQEVEKIRDEAKRNKVNELYNKSLEGSSGERPDDQLDEEEKQERDDAIKKSGDIEKEGDGSSGAPGRGKVGPGPNDVLGDSGKNGEKVDALVSEAQRQTGLLETIAEKLPDSNKIASASKPSSAPSKATTLGRT